MEDREPERTTTSVFRVGLVQAQDIQNCRVRVTFPDRNQLVSWWLPVVMGKTQNDKIYNIPDLGEQVVCLMDSHDEDGAVLGAIYSSADTTPVQSADKWHATMKDGSTFEYDRSTHTLAVNVVTTGTINITVNGGSANITANGGNLNLAAPNGDITFHTNEHTDSVNTMIDTYDSHTHGDPSEGNTTIPGQLMP
jgi:phage baseplate assembly protein V